MGAAATAGVALCLMPGIAATAASVASKRKFCRRGCMPASRGWFASKQTVHPAHVCLKEAPALRRNVMIDLRTGVRPAAKTAETKEIKMAELLRRSLSTAFFAAAVFCACTAHAKDYIKGGRAQERGYSEAVVTEGGKFVWLAGQTATVDDAGKSLAGDFDGQVRQLFKNLGRPLGKAG